MKEAAGEANITVITIVLIGIVAAVGIIIIPRLLDNVAAKSSCQSYLNGTSVDRGKTAAQRANKVFYCSYPKSDGTSGYMRMNKCDVAGEHKGEWIPVQDEKGTAIYSNVCK